MSKVILGDIDSLANVASAKQELNDNFTALEEAIDNCLSRLGTSPNAMLADIDMGEHKLLNVADPVAELDGVNLRSVRPLVELFAGEIAETHIQGTLRIESFVATAGQTDFVLDVSPGVPENVEVYDQGIFMEPGIDYTLGGTDQKTISFFSGRTLDNRIVARYVELAPSDSQLRADLVNPVSGKAAELIAFQQEGTGSVVSNVMRKLKGLMLSILDFVPTSEHDAILAGTSTWDATAAVQAAIDEAILTHRTLYAPGHYRLTSQIEVEGSLTLVGDGNELNIGSISSQNRGKGSWFHIDHTGVGFLVYDAAAFRTGVHFKSFGTYRTQPDPFFVGFVPTAHEWDIVQNGVDLYLEDMVLLNPTKGVQVLNGGYGRLSVNRLRGQPLQVGIDIDLAADVCRLREVHFWPFWSNDQPRVYTLANGAAIILRDVDNPQLSGIFTIGYKDGLLCSPRPSTSAMPQKVQLVNFDFDNGGTGIRVESGGSDLCTINAVNGYITGSSAAPAGSSNISISGDGGIFFFDNVGLDLPKDHCVDVNGTGNQLRFGAMSIGRWNFGSTGAAGIDLASGNIAHFGTRPMKSGDPTAAAAWFAGTGQFNVPLVFGIGSITTDGAGRASITHNLGITPRVILVTSFDSTMRQIAVVSASSTIFTMEVRTPAGALVTSTAGINVAYDLRY